MKIMQEILKALRYYGPCTVSALCHHLKQYDRYDVEDGVEVLKKEGKIAATMIDGLIFYRGKS